VTSPRYVSDKITDVSRGPASGQHENFETIEAFTPGSGAGPPEVPAADGPTTPADAGPRTVHDAFIYPALLESAG
jgi:hypothetical protein